MVQKDSIAEIIGSFGVGRQLNDLSSDSGPAETYDFTLRGSNRGESIGWSKWAGRKKVLTMRWTVNGPRGRRRRRSLATVHSSDEEKGKPGSTTIPLHCQDQTTALARPPVPGLHCLGVSSSKVMEMLSSLQTEWSWICYTKKMIFL